MSLIKVDKLNFGIFIDSLNLGGAEIMVIMELKALDESQFTTHLITSINSGDLLDQGKKNSDHYYCLTRKLPVDLISIIKLRKYLIENNIEIIHTHSWLDTIYAFIATLGLNIKKISSVHGLKDDWRFQLRLLSMRKFEKILCVSRFVKYELFRSGVDWERLLILPNTFDGGRFYKIETTKNSSDRFRILIVSRFDFSKDQLTVIEAVKELLKQGYQIELNVVGTGDNKLLERCLESVRDQMFCENIRFLGKIYVNSDFISKFDLCVSSSFFETFGISTLEAMACGVPVLVSDIPAFMELIEFGKYGLFFETGNKRDCAERIAMAIKNPNLLQQYSKKGLEKSKQLEFQKFKERTIELLSNM